MRDVSCAEPNTQIILYCFCTKAIPVPSSLCTLKLSGSTHVGQRLVQCRAGIVPQSNLLQLGSAHDNLDVWLLKLLEKT